MTIAILWHCQCVQLPISVALMKGGAVKLAQVFANNRILPVVQVGDGWRDLSALAPTLKELLALQAWKADVQRQADSSREVGLETAQFLPPICHPNVIFAIGRNYADHAAELQAGVPDEPVVFCKLSSCLIGHGAEVRLPPVSNQIDFEAELVIVIAKGGRDIEPETALEHVAGYTCGNDVTARDWQKYKPGGQWLLGKSFDTFAPLGPWLVTADEIPDPQDLRIELRLNGAVMQQSHTGKQLFPVHQLIAYVSQVVTLQPGDLIFSGTPAGVGAGRTPPVFLHAGDRVDVEIEKIGQLSNRVVAANESLPSEMRRP